MRPSIWVYDCIWGCLNVFQESWIKMVFASREIVYVSSVYILQFYNFVEHYHLSLNIFYTEAKSTTRGGFSQPGIYRSVEKKYKEKKWQPNPSASLSPVTTFACSLPAICICTHSLVSPKTYTDSAIESKDVFLMCAMCIVCPIH